MSYLFGKYQINPCWYTCTTATTKHGVLFTKCLQYKPHYHSFFLALHECVDRRITVLSNLLLCISLHASDGNILTMSIQDI